MGVCFIADSGAVEDARFVRRSLTVHPDPPIAEPIDPHRAMAVRAEHPVVRGAQVRSDPLAVGARVGGRSPASAYTFPVGPCSFLYNDLARCGINTKLE